MALRKRKSGRLAETGDRSISASDKIAALLALIATRDMDKDDAALKLDAIGFSSRDISSVLDVGPNYVNVARHRKKTGRRKDKKKG